MAKAAQKKSTKTATKAAPEIKSWTRAQFLEVADQVGRSQLLGGYKIKLSKFVPLRGRSLFAEGSTGNAKVDQLIVVSTRDEVAEIYGFEPSKVTIRNVFDSIVAYTGPVRSSQSKGRSYVSGVMAVIAYFDHLEEAEVIVRQLKEGVHLLKKDENGEAPTISLSDLESFLDDPITVDGKSLTPGLNPQTLASQAMRRAQKAGFELTPDQAMKGAQLWAKNHKLAPGFYLAKDGGNTNKLSGGGVTSKGTLSGNGEAKELIRRDLMLKPHGKRIEFNDEDRLALSDLGFATSAIDKGYSDCFVVSRVPDDKWDRLPVHSKEAPHGKVYDRANDQKVELDLGFEL